MKREKLKLVGTYSYIFKGFDELILTGECHEIYPPLDFSRSILIFLNLCFYVVFKNKQVGGKLRVFVLLPDNCM